MPLRLLRLDGEFLLRASADDVAIGTCVAGYPSDTAALLRRRSDAGSVSECVVEALVASNGTTSLAHAPIELLQCQLVLQEWKRSRKSKGRANDVAEMSFAEWAVAAKRIRSSECWLLQLGTLLQGLSARPPSGLQRKIPGLLPTENPGRHERGSAVCAIASERSLRQLRAAM